MPERRVFLARAVTVPGVITGFKTSKGSDSMTYRPVVEFAPERAPPGHAFHAFRW